MKSPLRKNMGKKNCEFTPDIRKEIIRIFLDMEESEVSMILDNNDFAYWNVTVERPLRLRVFPERTIPANTFKKADEYETVTTAIAKASATAPLDDWKAFAKVTKLKKAQLNKVRPFITEKDATAVATDEPDTDLQASDGIRVGQWDLSIQRMKEIPFYLPPRSEQDQIVRFLDWKVSNINKLINIKKKEIKDIDALKRSLISHAITHGLSADTPMKYSGVKWLGDIPAHWQIMKLRQILHSISVKNHPELPLLSVVREQGVILRDVEDTESNHNFIPDDLSGYKVVKKGQFAMNKMKAWQGSYGISDYTGIVSPAYFIFDVAFDNLEYFHYAIRSKVYVNFFAQASDGIRVGQWDLQMDKMKEIPFIIPPADEQNVIVEHIKNTLPTYNNAIEKLTAEVEVLEEYKTKIIADTVTGKIDVRDIEIPEYEFTEESADSDSEDADLDGDGEQED